MAFETRKMHLTCPTCSAEHTASAERLPVREPVHLTCRACGGTLLSGKAVFDYEDLKLKVS